MFIIHVFVLVCEADIGRCRKELDASIQDMSEGYNISHFRTMGKNGQTCAARYLFPGHVLFYITMLAVLRRGKPELQSRQQAELRQRPCCFVTNTCKFVHLVIGKMGLLVVLWLITHNRCYTVSLVTIHLFYWVQVHKFAASCRSRTAEDSCITLRNEMLGLEACISIVLTSSKCRWHRTELLARYLHSTGTTAQQS